MDFSADAKKWVEENIDWIDTLDISKKVNLRDFNKKVPEIVRSEVREIFKCIGIEITQPKRTPSGSLSLNRVNEITSKLQDLGGIKANWDEVRRRRTKDGEVAFYVCYIFNNPAIASDRSDTRVLTRVRNSEYLAKDGIYLDFGMYQGKNIAQGLRDRLNKEFPDNTGISMKLSGTGHYDTAVDVIIKFN